jgi:sugar-specific transcriptional regulator TrmB
VQRLRDVTIDTNTEVRALTRVKDAVQKALAVIDRDLKVNADSQAARQQRPAREKAADSADGLLQVERQHLNSIKKSLQVELGIIQQQLKALDAARRRLAEVTRERARVLDLVTHDSPAAHIDASTDQLDSDDTAGEVVDPLGAWTPEVEAALTEAQEAIGASSDLRLAAGRLLDTVNEMERTVTKAVNAGLTQKIVETSSLKHQLKSAADENRQATSKVQRLFNETELTWNQLRGPLTSEHLELRERLDRPVVKVVQRHPGNQMPEAQHIVAGSDALLGSLQCSGLTLGRLKLSQLRISDDASSKSAAIDVDSRVVRMRKRQATMYCM